jgi:hypothetical protein
MAEKKNQHYVPKQYLRFFSWDNKKQINIFNIKRSEIIEGASLADQCSEPYFYGKNLVIENGFAPLEKAVTKLLNLIIESNSAPKRFTEEHHLLLTYILFLHSLYRKLNLNLFS